MINLKSFVQYFNWTDGGKLVNAHSRIGRFIALLLHFRNRNPRHREQRIFLVSRCCRIIGILQDALFFVVPRCHEVAVGLPLSPSLPCFCWIFFSFISWRRIRSTVALASAKSFKNFVKVRKKSDDEIVGSSPKYCNTLAYLVFTFS